MRIKIVSFMLSLLLIGGVIGVVPSFGGEHPEHPTDAKKAEHPAEHPKSGKKAEHPAGEHPKGDKKADHSEVNMKQLAKAIKGYVSKDSALKGGYFLVYDSVTKKTLELKLDKVHKKRLAKVGPGVYFACADFKATDGKTYDLDIFMKGHSAKHLRVTEVSVHKVDGKARYGWVEKKGIWSKKMNK